MNSPILAILITVASGLAVVGVAVRSCAPVDQQHAEGEARAWAQRMGVRVKAVECVRLDSDGDGYVSCSVAQELPSGAVEPLGLECATSLTLNDGCRMMKGFQQ